MKPKIENRRSNTLLNYAMHYGAILGVFWAVKYLFAAYQETWSPFIYFYYLLNAIAFLLIYIFYFRYRDSNPEKPKGRIECVIFVVLMCFFASFFEGGMMFLHYQVLEPSFFDENILPKMHAIIEAFPYPEEVKIQAMELASSKILQIVSLFMGNCFFGIFIGGIFALIIGNKKLGR